MPVPNGRALVNKYPCQFVWNSIEVQFTLMISRDYMVQFVCLPMEESLIVHDDHLRVSSQDSGVCGSFLSTVWTWAVPVNLLVFEVTCNNFWQIGKTLMV